MATERRLTGKGPGRAPGLAVVLAAAALSFGTPAAPQDAAPLTPEQILALLAEGEALMAAGDYDGAWNRIATANDATFASDEYDSLVKHYPNLVFARYYYDQANWEECLRYAASVASALEVDGYGDHAYRTEALLFWGISAYEQGDSLTAERALGTAFERSRDVPDLARIHQLAAYYTARNATDIGAANAADLRAHFFSLDLDGGPVTVEQTAYVVFQEAEQTRLSGGDPRLVVQQLEYLIRAIDGIEPFSEVDRSFYSAYLGLAYAEAGRYDKALPIFKERHDYLLAQEDFGVQFYWNVQRRGMMMSILGDNHGARNFLREQVEFGKAHDAPPFQLAVLYRDLGDFSQVLGEPSVAQVYFRNAYSEMRKVLRANDPEVQDIRRRIDLRAADIRSFSFAPELGVVDDVDYELRADGADTLRLFFEGRYLVLDAVLDAREGELGNDPVFLANRALQQALIGEFDGAMATVARARTAVLTNPGAGLAPNAPMLDLAEALALTWSSVHQRDRARPVLERLKARMAILTPGERSMTLALEMFLAFQDGEVRQLPALFDAWVQHWRAGGPRDVWGIAAATLALEGSLGKVQPDLTDEVRKTTLADLAAQGTMSLAGDYIRLVAYLSGGNAIMDENAMTELGVLMNDIALKVPEDHSMVSASQFAMAVAMSWRNRLEESMDWMEKAAATLRSNPYHAKDTLAFLVSEVASLHGRLGRNTVAASMAKEAYDMIDIYAARQDLSSAVVETYAYSTYLRTGRHDRSAEIYRTHVEDPAYFDRLEPRNQSRMLQLYADSVASEDPDLVRVLLERAERVLQEDPGDTRRELSGVLWTRAIGEYYATAYDVAFELMVRANDINTDWQAEALAAGAIADIGALDAHNRAVWEAAIGWEYAQTLSE